MARTWLVTGASRGIGAEIAAAALAAGDRVVATARRRASLGEDSEQQLNLALDVTEEGAPARALAAAVARFGGVDILVNNAGYGELGLFEEVSESDARRQFDTNVLGLMAVTRAVLPTMRGARSGHIFNLSSIAGLRGGVGGSLYAASKHAVEGFSESLRLEVQPFGIHVTLIEPGFFRTDFLDESSARFTGSRIADYADAAAQIARGWSAKNRKQEGDPAKLAAAILQLSNEPDPPLRWVAGTDAIKVLEAKIAGLAETLERWRSLSAGTDFPSS